MLHVKTPEEVLALIEQEFGTVAGTETVSLREAMGRVLAEDIAATEYVPDSYIQISGKDILPRKPKRKAARLMNSLSRWRLRCARTDAYRRPRI